MEALRLRLGCGCERPDEIEGGDEVAVPFVDAVKRV